MPNLNSGLPFPWMRCSNFSAISKICLVSCPRGCTCGWKNAVLSRRPPPLPARLSAASDPLLSLRFERIHSCRCAFARRRASSNLLLTHSLKTSKAQAHSAAGDIATSSLLKHALVSLAPGFETASSTKWGSGVLADSSTNGSSRRSSVGRLLFAKKLLSASLGRPVLSYFSRLLKKSRLTKPFLLDSHRTCVGSFLSPI
jgi:hypothetical protein